MPPPLDVDREQVRMLVLSIGVREAARQLGLPESTVQSWSQRGKWLVGLNPAPLPRPASLIPATSATRSPVECLSDTLLADGKATKLAAMRFARRTTEHAANLAEDAPEQALASASDVKAAVQVAALAGSWGATNQDGGTVINIQMIGQQFESTFESQ